MLMVLSEFAHCSAGGVFLSSARAGSVRYVFAVPHVKIFPSSRLRTCFPASKKTVYVETCVVYGQHTSITRYKRGSPMDLSKVVSSWSTRKISFFVLRPSLVTTPKLR